MKYLFPHQEECIREIKHHFDRNIKPQDILADGNYSNRALVKAFCAFGKSICMYKTAEYFKVRLTVFVFPSLALVDQFNRDYIQSYKMDRRVLKICSDNDIEGHVSTSEQDILDFVDTDEDSIILITYASFGKLISLVDKIDFCYFDEAHHATSPAAKEYIFAHEYGGSKIVKSLFLTATPVNKNGICMYDLDSETHGVCGPMIYDYSYYRGCKEGYMNPFGIYIDLYTEDTNNSIYESIARNILQTY